MLVISGKRSGFCPKIPPKVRQIEDLLVSPGGVLFSEAERSLRLPLIRFLFKESSSSQRKKGQAQKISKKSRHCLTFNVLDDFLLVISQILLSTYKLRKRAPNVCLVCHPIIRTPQHSVWSGLLFQMILQ